MGEWFESWFNTDYYHALYNNRDDQEAARFIENLVKTLEIPESSSVLDLACGGGRHSAQLHQLGFKVTGVDLSENSINQARNTYHKDIRFEVGDMRYFKTDKNYDYVLNLFTSFGYFESMAENEMVMSAVKSALNPNGILVIDFMNAKKVLKNLVSEETQHREDLVFEIKRFCDGQHFYKNITVLDNGKSSNFQEKVQFIDKDAFENMLGKSSFEVKACYGSYDMDSFDETNSDRLIIVASKA